MSPSEIAMGVLKNVVSRLMFVCELIVETVGMGLLAILAMVLPGILVVKWLTQRPITFSLSPELTFEAATLVLASSVIAFTLVVRWVAHLSGSGPQSSAVVSFAGPKLALVAFFLSMPFAFRHPQGWWASLIAFSVGVASFYVSSWGFLGQKSAYAGKGANRGKQLQPPPDQGATEESGRARLSVPQITFADIYGYAETKARLLGAAKRVVSPTKDGGSRKPRNGILLTGEPGNGKTAMAEALAGELRLPFLQLTIADVASQWVGEKTARIHQAFEQAISHQPCVLFIDEVDSFLTSRDGDAGGTVKEDKDVVNALLTHLVDVRKHNVLVVAATNFPDRLDAASVREGRFDFKEEIPNPDFTARLGLLKKGLSINLPGARVSQETLDALARRWNGFNSKRILAITEELAEAPEQISLARELTFDDFSAALRRLQGRKGASVDHALDLDSMVLPAKVREDVESLVHRMANVERIERLGGTLPRGVLFAGPPGTGKTATAMALTKKTGWAFLTSTGAELARDPKALEKLYANAKDLRPAVIFVDEADELLRDRGYSSSTGSTNKLLTLMEGTGERVSDVVWIAATNNPDSIDAALLRRFGDKVQFELPDLAQISQFVQRWLDGKGVTFDQSTSVSDEAASMNGLSIALVSEVLQQALNQAILEGDGGVLHLQAHHLEAAKRRVSAYME